MMGYELERGQTFGVTAAPYLIFGWTCILAFILFVLTLIYFIRKKKKSRTFASIAGIGGYLVSLTLALIFDLETKSLSSQVMIFLSFVFPMVAVLSYYRMERDDDVR
jgi:RsiW-degrading membrane proteinase PrsW (M82 family)